VCAFSHAHTSVRMTLTLDLDLDVLKMYLYMKTEVCRLWHSKVKAHKGQTDRQTHRQMRLNVLPQHIHRW